METTGLNAPSAPNDAAPPGSASRAATPVPPGVEIVHSTASEGLDWDAIDAETTIRSEDWIEMDINARRPIFIGTKLSVELVIERLAWGYSESALLASHPALRPEHIRAALAYAAESIREYTKAMFAGRA